MPITRLKRKCDRCKDNRYEWIGLQEVRCRTCFEIDHFGVDYRERSREFIYSLEIDKGIRKLSENQAFYNFLNEEAIAHVEEITRF